MLIEGYILNVSWGQCNIDKLIIQFCMTTTTFNHTFNQTIVVSIKDTVSDSGVCVADLEAKLYLFSVLRH